MIEDIVYDKFAHLSIAGGITLGALRYANGTKHEKELMLRASVGVVIKQHSSDEDQAQYCTIDEGGYNMSAYVSKYHTYLRVYVGKDIGRSWSIVEEADFPEHVTCLECGECGFPPTNEESGSDFSIQHTIHGIPVNCAKCVHIVMVVVVVAVQLPRGAWCVSQNGGCRECWCVMVWCK